MQRFLYPAIFFKDDDMFKVLFPDIELVAEGKIVEEAFLYAQEFLRQYFIQVLKYDLDFNMPTDFQDIKNKCKKDDIVMLIDVGVSDKDIK